jgi:hypothetical protein
LNKNGSIKRLDYKNDVDKSIVSITQNGSRTFVRQLFDDCASERAFIMKEDGDFKQTSFNIIVK